MLLSFSNSLTAPPNKVPLLHSAVLNHNLDTGHAAAIETLLDAGARLDTVGFTPDGSDRSCIM
jgi:uncharacterized protein